MASRLTAALVGQHLTAADHPSSVHRRKWAPGYRVQQDSPRTVRVWHDGPDEHPHLAAYADALRAAGCTVTPEHPVGTRPRLRVTHP
ncbi:hypothetical protein AB0904_27820 [Streptomyces sp. NPDC006684]|uniref:hypothetical protein n=1 Tax=Streptomyces sp. NPDC006684 TaxID=3154477 RepID=UPI003452E745